MGFLDRLLGKKVYEIEGLGSLTWDPSSPRVKIARGAETEITVTWLCNEKVVTLISPADKSVSIVNTLVDKSRKVTFPFNADQLAKDLSKERKNYLLLHPGSAVVTHLLKTDDALDTLEIASTMAGLLICGNAEVKDEVAKAVWRRDYEPEYLFNVLANRGMFPSGIQPEEGKTAALILRKHCPEARKEWFRKKAMDLFGPTVAGVEVKKPGSNVKFKEKFTKPIDGRTMGTYEVYTAPSKAEALAFLEAFPVNKEYYYIEVETPEGPIGKDRMGIY